MVDPTFAAHVRRFLVSIAHDHVESETSPGRCAFDNESLDDGLQQHLLDVIAETFAEPPLKPHRVHVKGAIQPLPTETVQTPADESDPRPKGTKVTGSVYVGPASCPDCRQSLFSRGPDHLCGRLDAALALTACHPGCIVACGLKHG